MDKENKASSNEFEKVLPKTDLKNRSQPDTMKQLTPLSVVTNLYRLDLTRSLSEYLWTPSNRIA